MAASLVGLFDQPPAAQSRPGRLRQADIDAFRPGPDLLGDMEPPASVPGLRLGSVDQQELKRRIQGSGALDSSDVVQNVRLAIADCRGSLASCSRQVTDRCRDRFNTLPRSLMLLAVAVTLLSLWGFGAYLGALPAAPLRAVAAVLPGRGSPPSSAKAEAAFTEGEEGEEDEAPPVSSPSQPHPSNEEGEVASQSHSSTGSRLRSNSDLAKELVALRDAVNEGNRGIREELAALRSELARLRGGRGRGSRGSVTGSGNAAGNGNSESKPPRAPARAEAPADDDSRAGRVGSVRAEATPASESRHRGADPEESPGDADNDEAASKFKAKPSRRPRDKAEDEDAGAADAEPPEAPKKKPPRRPPRRERPQAAEEAPKQASGFSQFFR